MGEQTPKDRVDDGLQPLTLTTAVSGKVEKGFQDALAGAIEILEGGNLERFVATKGYHVISIPIEIALLRNVEDGTYRLSGRVNPVKLPKAVAVGRSAYLREGQLQVKADPDQRPLPFKPRAVVNGEGGEDD